MIFNYVCPMKIHFKANNAMQYYYTISHLATKPLPFSGRLFVVDGDETCEFDVMAPTHLQCIEELKAILLEGGVKITEVENVFYDPAVEELDTAIVNLIIY